MTTYSKSFWRKAGTVCLAAFGTCWADEIRGGREMATWLSVDIIQGWRGTEGEETEAVI